VNFTNLFYVDAKVEMINNIAEQ